MVEVRKKVLGIELYAGSTGNRPFFRDGLEKLGYSYDSYCVATERSIALLLKPLLIPSRLSQYDIIITSEYYSSFSVNLRLLLTRSKAKHVIIGLNQSRRLLKTESKLLNRMIDFVFGRTDLAIVHSRHEAQLFNRLHGISPARFYFSLWGYDLPPASAGRFATWPKPYVCLVGRNNRDIATFVAAVEGLKIDGIVVTSRHQLPQGPLPPNVHLFVDLPLGETLDCIKHARANAILLKDDNRGAGHITAVSAMLAGVPQIVSDVGVLRDYLVDGVTSIAVPLGDTGAVRSAMQSVIDDSAHAALLSTNALDYAQRWLTNEQAAERVVAALSKVARGQPVPSVDAEWLEAFELLHRPRAQSAQTLSRSG